jgi:hypothetical protein
MRKPIPWDIFGDRALNLEETIPLVGQNFTGATFACQVRETPDAAGSPLITPIVTLTYGGSDTIANHITAGRISAEILKVSNASSTTGALYQPTDTIALSLIHIHVDNSQMKIPYVPAADEAGDDRVLAWDLLVTPSGGIQDKWIAGKFIVRGTVTQ